MQSVLKFLLLCIATGLQQQTIEAACKIKNAQQRPLNITNAVVNEYDLDYLIKAGFDLNAQDSEGNTFLHVACQLGECAIIKKILDYKQVDLNKQNAFGITPLYTTMALRVDKEATMYNTHTDPKDYMQVKEALNLAIAQLAYRGAIDNFLSASLDVILGHENRIKKEHKQTLKQEIMNHYQLGLKLIGSEK